MPFTAQIITYADLGVWEGILVARMSYIRLFWDNFINAYEG
jgi:hypothetical protein